MHPDGPPSHDRMIRPTMDAADPQHMASLLSAQGHFPGNQERRLQEMATQVRELSSSLTQLTQAHGLALPAVAKPDR